MIRGVASRFSACSDCMDAIQAYLTFIFKDYKPMNLQVSKEKASKACKKESM